MKTKTEPGEIQTYSSQKLAEMKNIGMSKVDPLDILPPAILQRQALSDVSRMTTTDGKQPEIGQFYHTGKMEIYDTFECYIVYAAKSQYTDRRKPEEGKKDQYKIIGVLKTDGSLFGMTFKVSTLYTLSPLFTATEAQKRPMFSFVCKFEQKKLSNDKGDWNIPVLRITGNESNPTALQMVEDIARHFDKNADKVAEDMQKEENE